MILTVATVSLLAFGFGVFLTGKILKNKDAEGMGTFILIVTIWSMVWFQNGAQWQRDDWKDKIIQTHETTPSPLPPAGLMPE